MATVDVRAVGLNTVHFCGIRDLGCGKRYLGCRIQDFGCGKRYLGCRIRDLGCGKRYLGCRIRDFGCDKRYLGCGIRNFGYNKKFLGYHILLPLVPFVQMSFWYLLIQKEVIFRQIRIVNLFLCHFCIQFGDGIMIEQSDSK